MMGITRRLTWMRQTTETWVTEEQVGGDPDFIIQRVAPGSYRLWHRTSARPVEGFETVTAAKRYAETM